MRRAVLAILVVSSACIQVEAEADAASNWINVKDAPYSAVGDAKAVMDCATTISSPTVNCTSGTFEAGDVGKIVWCIGLGAGEAQPLIARTTIISRASATQVTMGANANGTTSGSRCIYGTQDDTSAFTAAYAAANADVETSAPLLRTGAMAGVVYIPSGNYIITGRIFAKLNSAVTSVSLVGDGPYNSVLFPAPDITIPGDGTAAIIQAQGTGLQFRDFGIDGNYMRYPLVADQDLVRIISATNAKIENVRIVSVGSTQTAYAISFRNLSKGLIRGVYVQNSPSVSGMIGCYFNAVGGVTVDGTVCSNMKSPNAVFENIGGRDSVTAPLVFIGGIFDECGAVPQGCTRFIGATVNFYGTNFYASSGSKALDVDGTSRVYLQAANVASYNGIGNVTGATIASGGRIYAEQSTFSYAGTGKAVANSGTFIDGGGNTYATCTGGTCTAKSAAQAFSGKLPVKQ